MKLVIQIPCYNEEQTLASTIQDLPVKLDGIEEIVVLVIDDGSTDRTVETARSCGVTHILSLPGHQGLARAFAMGIQHAARKLKADIVVNTDGDHQYDGACVKDLIRPVIKKEADIVVGARPIQEIEHFSPLKKLLQRWGSRTVRFITGIEIDDATSGFRAYSNLAARRLKIFSDFSYTIETLIQASQTGMQVVSVPVRINPPTRPSRLFTTNWNYIRRQAATMLRIWAVYSPGKLFNRFAFINLGSGMILFFRFLYFYFHAWPNPSGKVQSLLLAAVLLIFGVLSLLIGVIADLMAVQRKWLEELMDRMDDINRRE